MCCARGLRRRSAVGDRRIFFIYAVTERIRARVCIELAFLIDLGIASVPIFTADRAEAWGLEGTTASYLLSIMGVVNCISRVVWGQVMDK